MHYLCTLKYLSIFAQLPSLKTNFSLLKLNHFENPNDSNRKLRTVRTLKQNPPKTSSKKYLMSKSKF